MQALNPDELVFAGICPTDGRARLRALRIGAQSVTVLTRLARSAHPRHLAREIVRPATLGRLGSFCFEGHRLKQRRQTKQGE